VNGPRPVCQSDGSSDPLARAADGAQSHPAFEVNFAIPDIGAAADEPGTGAVNSPFAKGDFGHA